MSICLSLQTAICLNNFIMAGIFLWSIFGGFLFMGIAVILAIFLVGLIILIYNLQNGKQNHWPAKHIVGVVISSILMLIGLIAALVCFIYAANYMGAYTPKGHSSSSLDSESISTAIQYLMLKISSFIN